MQRGASRRYPEICLMNVSGRVADRRSTSEYMTTTYSPPGRKCCLVETYPPYFELASQLAMPNPHAESALRGSLKPGSDNTVVTDNSCSKPTTDESHYLIGVQPNRGVWFAQPARCSLAGCARTDWVDSNSAQSSVRRALHAVSEAPTLTGSICQIPSAYSRIARSEENFPEHATFAIDLRVHASRSSHAAAARSWAAA